MSKTKDAKKSKKSKNVDKHQKTATQKAAYKRGSLIKEMYSFFDTKGVDNVEYEECRLLAISIKPNTKFNKYHHSWYKRG